ncbi:MAG: Stealth CR1 domain-containing protein [Clostridia bacterium]|nr:Stealth CR1 domain-containing protein [Clostridia bacterium]
MNEEQIDVVICWVDGNDKEWKKEKTFWEQKMIPGHGVVDDLWNRGDVRFRDWGTLKYFFRGIEKNASWVHKVHFITWGHVPSWLDLSNPKLNIVRHDDYIPAEFLPTFNSHTIELNIHRIPGLAEKFVYFNDDMFVTRKTVSGDFFRNGLPCDSAVMNPPPMTRHNLHAEYNNIGVINDRFVKNRVIAEHPLKWFNLRYGTKILRNCLFLPWHNFVGFYEQHLPNSFLKSTFRTVWEEEEEELAATCSCKFRDRSNVNQWLMKNWQQVTGQFSPRSFKIGHWFEYGEDNNYDLACKEVREGRWKLLCVNDTEEIDDFEKRRDQLIEAFESLLPEKSKYEK